jgi:FAD/FMN-containing dehydrogenase
MKRRSFCASAFAFASAASLSSWRALAAAIAAEIPVMRSDGKPATLTGSDVTDLRGSLRGELLLSGDEGYDRARKVWNGSFDRHPALIARCTGAADVIQAVKFARAHDLLVAVRGGGHSLSGQSVCDGGLVIDLSRMRSVHVDPTSRIARLEPGVLLGEFDREAQFFGLATTAGTVSHTGAAGLTLGGGFGRIARKYGLACDNLIAAEVITADGRYVRTTEHENPELLWGLRGGGGNFGVVTSFEYGLHAVGPMMFGGVLIFPFAHARELLKFFAGFAADAPDELNADGAIASLPGVGAAVLFDICYNGRPEEAERVLAPLRQFRKPLQDRLGPAPYVRLQTSGDEANAIGRGYYERSGFVRRLEPNLIEAVVARMEAPHPDNGEIVFVHHGGAIGRVKPDATAFWHRDAGHTVLVDADWDDPNDHAARDANMAWARETWRLLERYTDGFYVNTLAADDPHQRVRATYGGNYPRLVALKDKYDPTNLFRMNANVPPSSSGART